MFLQSLVPFLDSAKLYYAEKWVANFHVQFKVTKSRSTKLGDYRKLPDTSHAITINADLPQDLFFFVLTHELAHLIAFEKFGRRINAHGKEWKHTFREMLQYSIHLYADDLQDIILKYSQSPKANFLASPDLVQYFRQDDLKDNEHFLKEIAQHEHFLYRNQKYQVNQKRKKNYLCTNLSTGKTYIFSSLAKVKELPL